MNSYPEPRCMDCGELCETVEEVNTMFYGHPEQWAYCKKCDVETFAAPLLGTEIQPIFE